MQSTILRRTGRAVAAGGAVLALVLAGHPAFAKGNEAGDDGGGSTTAPAATGSAAGDFAVTVDGTTYDPATLGVRDYTLTGAPAPDRMVTSPTVVFASRTPVLSAAQLRSPRLRELQVHDDVPVAIFGTAAGKPKVQAKDAPQVATTLSQTGTSTRWSVAPGGRMGGVLGEDAGELSQGATSCTRDCQAQNQVRGSVPVPPDPVDPTPIGG